MWIVVETEIIDANLLDNKACRALQPIIIFVVIFGSNILYADRRRLQKECTFYHLWRSTKSEYANMTI